MAIEDDSWAAVCELLSHLETQSRRFDSVTDGLMLAPESPLRDSFWRTLDASISACSKLIFDQFESLSWFVYECDFGKSPKEAGCEGDMRIIDSHDNLRWIIERDCGT